MSRPVGLARAAVLEWLTEKPGMTTAELAERSGYSDDYTRERMRDLRNAGFVRCDTTKAGARYMRAWFVEPNHPPVERKRRPVLPVAKVPPSMRMLRMAAPEMGQVVVQGPAPDHDHAIVGTALARMPELQAAWMGGRR